MTEHAIGQQRLAYQHISAEPFQHPEEVVRWMGAMQAQDYGQAVWGIGARLANPTLARVEQAIAEGKILRTWPMRGTIHFVPPEDALWMVQLSASRMIAKDQRRLHELELDESILKRCQDLFIAALDDGKPLPREQMLRLLEDAGIATHGGRGYHILWYIAQLGIIAIGPTLEKEQTFVLLEKWSPTLRHLAQEEALAELMKRYFSSHSPSTLQDFAWWAGLPVTEARRGLAPLQAHMTSEKVGKRELWTWGDAPAQVSSGMFLLCGFDEYLLGYQQRGDVLAEEHAQKVCPGKNGVFFPTIVQDGRVIGTWKRLIKKNSVTITRAPFEAWTPAQDEAFEAAALRYGAFLGLKVAWG